MSVEPDGLAHALRLMKIQIGSMPQEAQDDIQTFARSFRNMLAAGPVARIALLLVAAETALAAAARKMAEPR